MKRDQDGKQQAGLKKTLQTFMKWCIRIVGCLSEQVNIDKETVRQS